MPVYIALLRAVNVGGTGKLPMPRLKAACEGAGLENVATYIASGNLVFRSSASASRVKSILEEVLRKRFGLTKNHVMVRTPGELARAIAKNPFPKAAVERPNHLMVVFLGGALKPKDAKHLVSFDKRLAFAAGHLYVDYTEGVARAKFVTAPFAFLDKTLKLAYTGRNWNTVNKLLAMAGALD